jgi:hypothetical protein
MSIREQNSKEVFANDFLYKLNDFNSLTPDILCKQDLYLLFDGNLNQNIGSHSIFTLNYINKNTTNGFVSTITNNAINLYNKIICQK